MRNFILGLLLGGAAGSGITYYICKSRFEKTIAEERQKIRREYKEYYEKKQAEEDEAIANHAPAIPDKPVESSDRYVQRKQAEEIIRDNHYIYDPAESEGPTEDDLIAESEAINNMHDTLAAIHKDPKIIKGEHFGEIVSYDTESLTYYVEDQTLVHEDQSLVDDEGFLIGDALDRYGWRDDDEDDSALYVRNYQIQKDFEIIKVFGEYEPE